MTREILFKGKRIDNGEWVEGFYSQLPIYSLAATVAARGNLCAEDLSDFIIVNKTKQHPCFSDGNPLQVFETEQFEVEPSTVCQYTGLTDKNGQKIWENDIVKSDLNKIGKIAYNETHLSYLILENAEMKYYHVLECDGVHIEVIGNIFDNPELLRWASEKRMES